MQDFQMSGANMNELLQTLEKIRQCMNDSYQGTERLLEKIEEENCWQGKSKDTFMVYMGLLKAYHKRFTDKETEERGNPLQEAIEALKELESRVDSFYDYFTEYKKLERIDEIYRR